ncbi:MAG: hypothetical protein AABY32_01135 [Nanoarchaeota archaeon]
MRLTPVQKKFLDSLEEEITDKEDRYEEDRYKCNIGCEKHEWRTAVSLQKKGLIKITLSVDDKVGIYNYFEVQLVDRRKKIECSYINSFIREQRAKSYLDAGKNHGEYNIGVLDTLNALEDFIK